MPTLLTAVTGSSDSSTMPWPFFQTGLASQTIAVTSGVVVTQKQQYKE
jgi:hypothetical protein